MLKKLFIIILKIFIGWIISSVLLGVWIASIEVENEAGKVVLSSSSGGLLAVFSLLVIFGIPIWAIISTLKNKNIDGLPKEPIGNRKQKRLSPRKQHLNRLFQQHKAQLVRNFNRTVIPNEYGAVDAKSIERWRNEILRFLDSINLPKYLFKKQQHLEEAIEYINQLTQNHIRELEEQSDVSVNFEGITDPNIYEIACAKELKIYGWQAQVSPVGADQGIDVRANKEGLNVVIQCKLYSNPVGNKAVQEALSGKAFDKADFAVVVAPNGYTRSALELAQSTGVLLLSHNDLKNLFGLISSR